MTLTASTNLLMSSIHRRWMTMKETLVIQGMPVSTEYTHGVPCSSYALREHQKSRGLPYFRWPSKRAASEQAGNSMHTSVSGLVFLYTLSQVVMDDRMMLAHYIMLQRKTALGYCPIPRPLVLQVSTQPGDLRPDIAMRYE